MKEGSVYGNNNLYDSNTSDASNQPLLATVGTQEDLQIKESEFKTSNSRLDNYHLTFSSKL